MKELDNDRSSPLLRRWVFFSRNRRRIRESKILAREQSPTGPTHTHSQLDESVCSRSRRFLGFGAHCNFIRTCVCRSRRLLGFGAHCRFIRTSVCLSILSVPETCINSRIWYLLLLEQVQRRMRLLPLYGDIAAAEIGITRSL